MTVHLHDPDAVLDYTWDWSSWLNDGATIDTGSVTVDSGLTVSSTTTTATTVTAVLSTDGTLGRRNATCHITTTDGLTQDWTIELFVHHT